MTCSHPDCEAELNARHKRGLCAYHAHLARAKEAWRKNHPLKQKESESTPKYVCAENGCGYPVERAGDYCIMCTGCYDKQKNQIHRQAVRMSGYLRYGI